MHNFSGIAVCSGGYRGGPPLRPKKKIKILTSHKAPLLCIKLTLLVSTVFAGLRQSQMSPISCIGDVRMEPL